MIIGLDVFSVLRKLRFLDGGYMYLVSGEVLDDVSLHFSPVIESGFSLAMFIARGPFPIAISDFPSFPYVSFFAFSSFVFFLR